MGKIPSRFRAGDTVAWDESPIERDGLLLQSATWTGVTYLRFSAGDEGLTISGSAKDDGGWAYLISAAASAGMTAGNWYWQTKLSSGDQVITTGSGSLRVDPDLSYSGTAEAFDGRSQARKDLEAVQAAIRSIIAGGAVNYYMIGQRQLRKMSMAELLQLESKLKADVAREERAEKIANGFGDPRKLYVRFRR